MVAKSIFKITGQVKDRKTEQGVPGLRVEVWDKDQIYHSLLGIQDTDGEGNFAVTFDETYFGDFSHDRLPDIFFRVFSKNALLYSTEGKEYKNVPAGYNSFVLTIDVPQENSNSADNLEVGIHELGESIAASLASIQQELNRYPNTMGAFLLDEVDLEIPVSLRVDCLGQVKAKVQEKVEEGSSSVGRLHLKVKPVLGAEQPPVPMSDQSLEDLKVLSPEEIQLLKKQRIFSVNDLLRVSRNVGGRLALEKLGLKKKEEELKKRGAFLYLPMIPLSVKQTLLQADIKSPQDFMEQDAEKMAALLSKSLKTKVNIKEVQAWQQEVRKFLTIPRPKLNEIKDIKDFNEINDNQAINNTKDT